MTPIAEQLIYSLRHDAFTRKHFDISDWSTDTCNTVGCIAGTAVFMEMGDELREYTHGGFRLNTYLKKKKIVVTTAGQRILGIPFRATALDLFLPDEWCRKLVNHGMGRFKYLPEQARPDLDTAAKMKSFAKEYNIDNPLEGAFGLSGHVGPDHAALALERIVKDEIPYCDWAYAFEHA
jgi:hypothetical protein